MTSRAKCKNWLVGEPPQTRLYGKLRQRLRLLLRLLPIKDTLTGANSVLLSYVNSKIEELDGPKQKLVKKGAELSVETVSPEQVKEISGYLDTWDEVNFDDKRNTNFVNILLRIPR